MLLGSSKMGTLLDPHRDEEQRADQYPQCVKVGMISGRPYGRSLCEPLSNTQNPLAPQTCNHASDRERSLKQQTRKRDQWGGDVTLQKATNIMSL